MGLTWYGFLEARRVLRRGDRSREGEGAVKGSNDGCKGLQIFFSFSLYLTEMFGLMKKDGEVSNR